MRATTKLKLDLHAKTQANRAAKRVNAVVIGGIADPPPGTAATQGRSACARP
jgi:hypothetical protein